MKIMFIAYHDILTEARTQEILKCAEGLGDAYFVSYSKPKNSEKCISLLTGNGIRGYRSFIKDSIKYIKEINPDVIILHDNYTSIILAWLIKFRKNTFIIYDSSELYIDLKPKKLKQRLAQIMQYIENKYLRYADVTIAANIERASIMEELQKLEKKPLVFDNIHKIEDSYDEIKCNEKYGEYFRKDVFTVLYAGGISENRKTYELADAVGKLGNRYSLIVIGAASNEEKNKFKKYLEERKYYNINYLGFIPREEFRFLLNKACVSVSAFAQDTLNNKFCASGKVYESIFEGTPILTTENPPLKRICKEYGVGISTSNFKDGIKSLQENYDIYCNNVVKYAKQINYEERIDILQKSLENFIEVGSKSFNK